jgi:hypothetical protein
MISSSNVPAHNETQCPMLIDMATKKRAVKKPEVPAKMGRPIGLRGPLRALADILGGVDRLADEVGVRSRTIHRWGVGLLVPRRPTRLTLAALARLHGIEPPFDTGPVCPRPAWLDLDDEVEAE